MLATTTLGGPARPNVIVILADDLGYADLGCQGSKEVQSPHIDSLAANGVRCTSGYVTAPICSPSRAGLITGRYQQHFGHEFNLGPQNTVTTGMPTSQKTVADYLRAAGYVTGALGKWDLGSKPQYHPLSRGFDEFFGFLGGSRSYFPETNQVFFNRLQRGRELLPEESYLTDAIAREAADFIRRHRAAPFFLYVAFTAPHWPMEAKPEQLKKFAHVRDLHRRTFLAMMASLDDGVGGILKELRESGIETNTLLIFLSDNGGATGGVRPNPDAPFQFGVNTSRNDPCRGVKGDLWEGGVRVPFLVQWKGRLPAGKVFDEPVSSLDILPTALALAEVNPLRAGATDGVDFLPWLTGNNSGSPHESLYWRVGGKTAIRQGAWKLVRQGDGTSGLYDLTKITGEQNDVATQYSETGAKLTTALHGWNSELVKPLWSGDPKPALKKK